MAPKIHAVIRHLECGRLKAVITSPDKLERAVAGRARTTIVRA
jgi:carbamate kinase